MALVAYGGRGEDGMGRGGGFEGFVRGDVKADTEVGCWICTSVGGSGSREGLLR